jgi:FG-GAP repeat
MAVRFVTARILTLCACVGAFAVATSGAAGQSAQVPQFRLAVGLGPHAHPLVKVYDSGPSLVQSFVAFNPQFGGGVSVAVGDVNNDGALDIVTGAGPGAVPHVKVFSGSDLSLLKSFFAYSPSFSRGVRVAAGDVNEDGFADIVTGPGIGAHVKVFSGLDLSLLHSFLAYPGLQLGGVHVAAGDVNGDARADIATGAGLGAAPHVKVFSGSNLSLLKSFFAYPPAFVGGVSVAIGDVDEDRVNDIVTGPGPHGGGHVKVFAGDDLALLRSFVAYANPFTQGVRVAAGDMNGDGNADVVTGAGPGIAQRVKVFSGLNTSLLASLLPFGPHVVGGVWVAAARQLIPT